jgi:hypothetical protein
MFKKQFKICLQSCTFEFCALLVFKSNSHGPRTGKLTKHCEYFFQITFLLYILLRKSSIRHITDLLTNIYKRVVQACSAYGLDRTQLLEQGKLEHLNECK